MKSFSYIKFIVMVLVLFGRLWGSDTSRRVVAIWPTVAVGVNSAYAKMLNNVLFFHASRKSVFRVVDRSALENVIREQKLGLLGITDLETGALFGKMVGAQLSWTSELYKSDIFYYLNVRAVNVKTGEVEYSDAVYAYSIEGLYDIINVLVDRLEKLEKGEKVSAFVYKDQYLRHAKDRRKISYFNSIKRKQQGGEDNNYFWGDESVERLGLYKKDYENISSWIIKITCTASVGSLFTNFNSFGGAVSFKNFSDSRLIFDFHFEGLQYWGESGISMILLGGQIRPVFNLLLFDNSWFNFGFGIGGAYIHSKLFYPEYNFGFIGEGMSWVFSSFVQYDWWYTDIFVLSIEVGARFFPTLNFYKSNLPEEIPHININSVRIPKPMTKEFEQGIWNLYIETGFGFVW